VTAGRALAVHVTAPSGIEAELAADALWQAGAAAVEERALPSPAGVALLVAATADGGPPDDLVAAVAGRWPVAVVLVDVDAALDAWRAHARAVTVGPVTVRPAWVERRPSPAPAVEVVLDPGRAFGSGAHVSTRLALAALVTADPAVAQRVVDVGCGSGVLAVAALLLGARTAVGVDVDPEALAATRANADRNGVVGLLATVPTVGEAGNGDLVVANILAPVLIELAPAIRGTVRPGGTLVLAGFLAEQRDRVRAAYSDLVDAGEAEEDGWVSLTLRRPGA
jgi:ribosomal protein L11 methyltransferase